MLQAYFSVFFLTNLVLLTSCAKLGALMGASDKKDATEAVVSVSPSLTAIETVKAVDNAFHSVDKEVQGSILPASSRQLAKDLFELGFSQVPDEEWGLRVPPSDVIYSLPQTKHWEWSPSDINNVCVDKKLYVLKGRLIIKPSEAENAYVAAADSTTLYIRLKNVPVSVHGELHTNMVDFISPGMHPSSKQKANITSKFNIGAMCVNIGHVSVGILRETLCTYSVEAAHEPSKTVPVNLNQKLVEISRKRMAYSIDRQLYYFFHRVFQSELGKEAFKLWKKKGDATHKIRAESEVWDHMQEQDNRNSRLAATGARDTICRECAEQAKDYINCSPTSRGDGGDSGVISSGFDAAQSLATNVALFN